MWRSNRADTETLRCSFCHKSQNLVRKLISSPNDYPRAYICDECVAVCQFILADDAPEKEGMTEATPDEMCVFRLLEVARHWIAKESSGADATQELAMLRRVAMGLIGPGGRT